MLTHVHTLWIRRGFPHYGVSLSQIFLFLVQHVKKFEVNPFYNVTYRTPVTSITSETRPLITIDADASVLVAMEVLHANRVLAAPVFNPDNSCIGSIDVLSILRYLFSVHVPSTSFSEFREKVNDLHSLWRLLAHIPVRAVVTHPLCSHLTPFFQANPVSMLVDLMAASVHRVALFRADKELIGQCSQTDLIRYLAALVTHSAPEFAPVVPLPGPLVALAQQLKPADIAKIKDAARTPVAELNLFRPAQSISGQCSMLEALYTLAADARRAVSVEDESGAMICELSVSDLHLLSGASFADLRLSVSTWLTKHSQRALTPPCVRNDVAYGSVVMLLAVGGRHRLWVLDDAGKATHVITNTDVLRAVGDRNAVDMRAVSGDTDIGALWRRTESNDDSLSGKFCF